MNSGKGKQAGSRGVAPSGGWKPRFPALPPCVLREKRCRGLPLVKAPSVSGSEARTSDGIAMPAAELRARLKKLSVLSKGK